MIPRQFLAVLLLISTILLVSCSSTPMRRSFSEYWQDKAIAMNVRSKLVHNKEVEFSGIHVYTWRGVVSLLGRTVTEEEKELAESLAAEVENVVVVRNYLDVIADDYISTETEEEKAPPANEKKYSNVVRSLSKKSTSGGN